MHLRRFRIITLTAGLLLGGLLVQAPVAQAAPPALTLTPDRGRCVQVTARGANFPVGRAIRLFIEVGRAAYEGAMTTVASDGTFTVGLRNPLGCDPGEPDGTQYRISATSGDPKAGEERVTLASATFTVGAPSAGPALTLEPDRGPCDVPAPVVIARGRDFPPGRTITLIVRRVAPFSDQGAEGATTVAAADGTFTTNLRLATCEPSDIEGAQFRVTAQTRDGRDLGPVLASATFTKTAATGRRACFTETGRCVAGRFLAYWEDHGGLAINGYPLTGEFRQTLEDGREYTVQYFERVRLEYHPENTPPYDVLLGQFGRRLHPADPPVPAEPGYTYFPETGHNVGPRFTTYWQANGGLAQFGYPLSELLEERLEDGNVYLVQYFERARFEYHPEHPQPYDVLLGQFGRRILEETTR